MSSRSLETKKQIIQAALSLLKESGIEGLTMRKVALASAKSLNNVQHHFKTKSDLLNGMAAYYFAVCEDMASQYVQNKVARAPKEELYEVILYCLNQANQISDACLVFRELWAVATRNKDVEQQLVGYYSQSLDKLCGFWQQYELANAQKAASILLPYLDGYSIQHKALPLSKEQIAEVLTESLLPILTAGSDS
ncbi:TetR/AcrR family transcriptional regulator [Agarivorans sp.]|uniref:TetR/AcrR family transcriptional regulator n=1 Tax=Agarivorans sp. TaxID=1872412 RepID=UPI003CFD13CD